MGLLSNIKRVFSDVRDIGKALVPTIVPLIGAGFLGAGLGRFLQSQTAAPPMEVLTAGAGGSLAVRAANQTRTCPPIGFAGNQVSSANPIFRAANFPAFNPATIPSRPLQAQNSLIQQLLASLQGPRQQTTSFNQSAFGATVSPSFRPFTPSFRSGQAGISGEFRPGISRGLAPDPLADFKARLAAPSPFQTQSVQMQFQPRVQQFGGFGGLGFGGF